MALVAWAKVAAVKAAVSKVAKVRRKAAVKAAVNKVVAVNKAVAVVVAFSPCPLIASSAFPIGPSAWSTASAIRIRA